ncbi:MAG TPA: hypothetical protein VGQ57_03775 [Polyangiaceae bacterium]|jgi:hypothetical protein|nr:hypothetical protein [Polyangiaceae bacterium]
MSRLVGLCALVMGVAFTFASPPARADEAQEGEADTLFERGVELMKADNCAEAIPEFLKSNELDASSGTLLNLATCYARLGRKATAYKTYQSAAGLARTEKNDQVHERAVQAMTILAPTLTRVQIVPPKGAPQLSLRLNGDPLVDYDGLPIPLDPGESVIEAAAPGREPWRHSVTANDLGATIVVHVPELPPAHQPQLILLPREDRQERPGDWRVPAAVIAGTGLAAVVVGSVFGLSAAQSYDDSQSYCAGSRCTQPGIDLRNTASTKAAVATWTVSLGLVATATGVVLWLTSPPHGSRHRSTAMLKPSLLDGSNLFMNVAGRR